MRSINLEFMIFKPLSFYCPVWASQTTPNPCTARKFSVCATMSHDLPATSRNRCQMPRLEALNIFWRCNLTTIRVPTVCGTPSAYEILFVMLAHVALWNLMMVIGSCPVLRLYSTVESIRTDKRFLKEKQWEMAKCIFCAFQKWNNFDTK